MSIIQYTTFQQTSFVPEKETYHMTKAQMLASMDSCMGGRAAEELVFGHDRVTSGASVDFLVSFLTVFSIYYIDCEEKLSWKFFILKYFVKPFFSFAEWLKISIER